jgi:hypothetical protein
MMGFGYGRNWEKNIAKGAIIAAAGLLAIGVGAGYVLTRPAKTESLPQGRLELTCQAASVDAKERTIVLEGKTYNLAVVFEGKRVSCYQK